MSLPLFRSLQHHVPSIAAAAALVSAPLLFGVFGTTNSPAQTAATEPRPISYVSSVKPNVAPDARSFSEYSPGGRFTAVAVTLGALLRIAYRVQPYQLVGLPASIATRRYDISAKIDDSPAPSQRDFLRALLKDRFQLAAHNDTRELPIFALVVARSDGKLGAQLRKSDFDCAAYLAGPHDPPQPGRTPNCATRIGMGSLSGKAIPMSQLAASLAPFVSRFTVDKTELRGSFDVELNWTPEPPSALPSSNAEPATSGPSIFTALQEQLGLKLAPQKGPVAVLVVDHVEEPSAN